MASPGKLTHDRPRQAAIAPWYMAVILGATAILFAPSRTRAQELEPRAYSASPVGANFVAANYTRLSGEVLTDTSLPVTDVHARIDIETIGYVYTFAMAGRSASLGFLVPFTQADVSGNVFDAPNAVRRTGPGDARVRFAMGLVGAPALTPEQFSRRDPAASVGASLTVIAPTGKYLPSRLINIGTNRWAFKPEIGMSWPVGDWFIEATAGVWLFTDNAEFLETQRRSQAPLAALQFHAGYLFRPGMWLAANTGFYAGGETEVDGIDRQDWQKNTRYGLTLSLPLTTGWSARINWSKGLTARSGGNFRGMSATVQYRWFDR